MLGLWWLSLKGTQISEVAFPEGVCPNLGVLHIEDCQELMKIRGLHVLSKLDILCIQSCVKVEELESLETLGSLWDVHVSGCTRIGAAQNSSKPRG
jgi:hypothetical protein